MSLFHSLISVSGGYDSDAQAYFGRVVSAGGSLSNEQKTAFNTAILSLKSNSLWNLLDELAVFSGGFNATTNLGALQKIKYYSASALTNTNFVGADYSGSKGLKGNGTNKKLDTGYNPTTAGRTATNQTYGLYLISDYSQVNPLSGIPLGSTSGTYMCLAGGSTHNSLIGALQPRHFESDRLKTLTCDASSVKTYNGSVLSDTKGVPSTVSNSNIVLFNYNNSFYYNGFISGYFTGQKLNASQVSLLSGIMDDLHYSLGRITLNRNAYFGDSITFGSGASAYNLQWSYLVNSTLSGDQVNLGISGSVLQNTSALANNGYDRRYSDLISSNPDSVYILYGVNDLRYNSGSFTSSIFQTQLTQIIQDLITSGVTPNNITVGSPPYVNPAFYASGAPYDGGSTVKHVDYVAKCRASVVAVNNTNGYTTLNGVKYADVYNYMLSNGGNSLVSADGIHPNNSGHTAIKVSMLAGAAILI